MNVKFNVFKVNVVVCMHACGLVYVVNCTFNLLQKQKCLSHSFLSLHCVLLVKRCLNSLSFCLVTVQTSSVLYMLLVSPVRKGQGLTQVIEKAETSLGIPSPTELSAQVEEEEKEQGKALLLCLLKHSTLG